MERIGLMDTIQALRAELARAAAQAPDEDLQFPIGEILLEFDVGVTREVNVKGGYHFWILQLDGGGSYTAESIQRVTIKLDPPVNANGERVLVTRGSNTMP